MSPPVLSLVLLLAGGAPDSLAQRLATLDHAIHRGAADSVWRAASRRAGRDPADRLAALEAGVGAAALSRPEADDLLRRSLSDPDTLADLIDVEAAAWLGALAARAGNAAQARVWLERGAAESQRRGAERTWAHAVTLLAELDIRQGRAADGLRRLGALGLGSPGADALTRSRVDCSRARTLAVLARHEAADSSARSGLATAQAAGLDILAASCLTILGVAQAQRATFFPADSSLARAVAILQGGGSPRTLGVALMWRGYVLRELTRLSEADSVLRLAVALADGIGDASVLAWARLNLGLIASAFGDLHTASADLGEAIVAFDAVNDQWGRHTGLLARAHVLQQLGALDGADSAATAVLAWAGRAGIPLMTVTAHNQLGWIAERRGRNGDARAQFERAAQVAHTSGLTDARLFVAYQLARHDVVTGQYRAAIPRLRAYLASVQTVSQRQYVARARLAQALAGSGDIGGATAELDRAMGDLESWRASLSSLELRRAAFAAALDDPDPDLGVGTVIARIAEAGDVATAFALAERRRARMLADQLRRLGGSSAESVERLASALDHQAARAMLPDHSSAVITFVAGRGPEPLTVFILTRDTLVAAVLPPLDRLSEEITRATVFLTSGEPVPAALRGRLGSALVDPITRRLPPDIRRMLIVPEGLLHQVPFELLSDDRHPEPLAARFALSYGPSASVLVSLRGLPARTSREILVLADPPAAVTPAAGHDRTGAAAWGRLPGARREARMLKKDIRAVRAHVGSDAQEAIVAGSAAATARVLHFATHAQVDERSPLGSYVLLAAGRGADGRLTSGEIESLRFGADLVVLSACRTATGRVLTGEGVQGLTAPFLAAGARSVVASRWDVGDEATARFMKDFYHALGGGAAVGDALTAAQRRSMTRGEPPQVWAAFIAVGDPWAQPDLQPKPALARGWATLVLVAGGGLTAWWARRRRRRTGRGFRDPAG